MKKVNVLLATNCLTLAILIAFGIFFKRFVDRYFERDKLFQDTITTCIVAREHLRLARPAVAEKSLDSQLKIIDSARSQFDLFNPDWKSTFDFIDQKKIK